MSTKTLRKRIALVAVAALGAGVLSVAPASAAAPTSIVFSDDYQTSSTWNATKNYGVCYSAEANDTTYTANAVATTAQNNANVVEMTSTGKLNFSGAAAAMTGASDELRFDITGPAVFAGYTAANSQPANATLSATMKSYTFAYDTGDDAAPTDVQITPTGVGTIQVTISHYDHTSLTDASAGVSVAKIVTVYSVATCGAGTYSATYSNVKVVAVGDIATAVSTSNDASNASTAENAGAVYVRVDLRDANGTALSDGASYGTVTAEVTGGLVVGAAATGSTTVAYSTDKSTYFKVTQGTANTPQTGTVTIKIDGVTVTTKSVSITGPAASIEVSGLDVRLVGGSATQTGDYVVKDSAGNALAVAISGFVTLTDAQAKILTAGSSTRTPDPTSLLTPKGQFSTTCSGSKGGTATGLQLKYVSSALVTITSPAFSLTCGSTVYSYTASLDKATYVPGDIATLTISAKDLYGNVVHDSETIGTAGAGTEASIAGSNMTAVVAPTNADTFTGGVKTYKYIVGSTEGSYNMVVDLDEHTSSSTGQSAVTIAYKIAGSTAAVSNADVLKAIVSLIASINKQIAALQKALLKK
jgi:trimeric autotransporter adhesin